MLDAVIVGAGFYGVALANYLVEKRKLKSIALIERESEVLQRASRINQARVHNGYHYPRSFTTAFRSRINLPRFVEQFPSCISRDGSNIYAIARRNSRVTARQFRRFCGDIGARLGQTPVSVRELFDRNLIEETYLVEEFTFDTRKLADWARACIARDGIDLQLNSRVSFVERHRSGRGITATVVRGDGERPIDARFLFNCTYSGLNQFGGDFPGTADALKHEITEMALLEVPEKLSRIGVTVMDGPFFSMMPYPAGGTHSLSHVRYTPHLQWRDSSGDDPYARLAAHSMESRVDWMIRDARRYMPALNDVRHVVSLFEIKTVLVRNEVDDGRPILFERHQAMPDCFSILGAKLDNIYDVLERLDAERL